MCDFCNIAYTFVIWKVLIHWVMQVLEMLTLFTMTFVHITIILRIASEKPLDIGKLSSSQWWIQFFQIFIFTQKLKFYHWKQILCYFLQCKSLTSLIFKKMSYHSTLTMNPLYICLILPKGKRKELAQFLFVFSFQLIAKVLGLSRSSTNICGFELNLFPLWI